jgi:hypothetical protein
MNKIKLLAAVAALLVIAFISNPGAERHREKITAAIGERSQVQRVLGIGELTSFFSTYHSLGIASYSTVNDKLVAIGAFGMVFVTN